MLNILFPDHLLTVGIVNEIFTLKGSLKNTWSLPDVEGSTKIPTKNKKLIY